jgi:SAM-dependent methyltransferase
MPLGAAQLPFDRLCCPECRHGGTARSADLAREDERAVCKVCGAGYPIRSGVLDLRFPRVGSAESAAAAQDFYDQHYADGSYGREDQSDHLRALERWLAELPVDRLVLELGTGRGALQGLHPGYVGTDLSVESLSRWLRAPGFAANGQALPLRDGSVDFLFSIAVLEHFPEPERGVAEIARVLARGGVAYLAPAWHCRPWAAEGLHVRPWSDLRFWQRCVKATIPLRGSLAWRGAFALPRRAARRLRFQLSATATNYRYRKLRPNYEIFWAADSDATASLDPHETALYFESRGFEVLSPAGGWKSVLHRAQALVVRKTVGGS